MKYGLLLEIRTIPEWRQFYLSYKKLKRLLVPLEKNDANELGEKEMGLAASLLGRTASMNAVEVAFMELLEADIEKINAHATEQRTLLLERVDVLLQQNNAMVVRASPSSDSFRRHVTVTDNYDEITSVYCDCAKLRSFVNLNHEGIRKIVKKLDKNLNGPKRQAGVISRLKSEPFMKAGQTVEELIDTLERMTSGEQLLRLRRAGLEAISPNNQVDQSNVKVWALLVAALVAILVGFSPQLSLGDDHVHEQRCLAMLVGVIVLWLTEAQAYFVTALLIPALIVVCRVLPATQNGESRTLRPSHPKAFKVPPNVTQLLEASYEATFASRPQRSLATAADDGSLVASEAAKLLLSSMFDHLIFLVLAGLTSAAIVSHCQLELRLASALHSYLAKRPLLFAFILMQLGLFISMCISNVTTPILLLSVIQPILRELPEGAAYARLLVLGLAFSCDLGGMLTPIASPQNAIALEALLTTGAAEITFGGWLLAALPVCQIGLLIVFGLLLVLLRPFDVKALPAIHIQKRKALGAAHIAMLCVVAVALVLFATLSFPPFTNAFGDPAIVGLLLIVIAFGSGFLSKDEFNGLAWHLLVLIAGGNALGVAVTRSGLLKLASQAAHYAHTARRAILDKVLSGTNTWLLTAELVAALLFITTFISHTVAAIVAMPLAATIGAASGQPARVVFCCALTCSAAMALPMSSFPNVNSLLAEDDYGRPYLRAADFVKVGLPASLCMSALIATLGYAMAALLF